MSDFLGFIARPTPQLRTLLRQQQTQLPASEFAEFLVVVRSLFAKYQAHLRESPPGAERARSLHRLMNRELAATATLPITCGRGCAGCCHYEVEVTPDEAALIAETVNAGLVIDRERLALQAARERKSPEWRRFNHRDNRCVFLGDDNACRIYEQRPSICRKHVVTTPPANCTTEGAPVAPVQVLLAEILLSTALSLDDREMGSLPRLVAQHLEPAAG